MKPHVAAQKEFYESRAHRHLRASAFDLYARNLAHALAERAGLAPGDRVLEVGAGFGRFSFSLLERCGEIEALDLAPGPLAELERERDARGIPASRLRPRCLEVDALDSASEAGGYDAVVGFYFLHHLPDFPATLARLARLLRPGGRMAFLEPNRRNQLFLAQVACCPDMTWREEKGMFRLSRARVEDAFRRAGLASVASDAFGFFPPPVYNRSARARRLEARLERIPWLRGWLPYLVCVARTPGGPAGSEP